MQYLDYFKFLSKSKRKRKKIIIFLANESNKQFGKQKKGKQRADMKLMIAGILYYLKSGCTWEMLPNDFGPHQTVYGWYVKMCDVKLFEILFPKLKIAFFKGAKKQIERLCSDGSLVQHCRKNELTGINPRNKNKNTINRMVTTNEDGLPLDIIICHGTAHDSIFFATSIYNSVNGLELKETWYSHADKAFDSYASRKFIKQRGGIPEIPYRDMGKNKGVINKKDSYRFVVERYFAWSNSCKNLKVVFIKNADRIKQMSLLFANIVYLRRFSESNIMDLMTGLSY